MKTDIKAAEGTADSARSRRTIETSIDAAIARRLRRAKPGTVFTPALFASLGGRAAIDKALQRLAARRVAPSLARPL